jgi:hypothetical protein
VTSITVTRSLSRAALARSPQGSESSGSNCREPFQHSSRYYSQVECPYPWRSDDGVVSLQEYKRAEEILAEIEATNAVSKGTETALAIQARAHAIPSASFQSHRAEPL